MTTKHTPATPLPWNKSGAAIRAPYGAAGVGRGFTVACTGDDPTPGNKSEEQMQDATYIAHAANAYPRLVEAMRDVLENYVGERTRGLSIQSARALLRELGEDA